MISKGNGAASTFWKNKAKPNSRACWCPHPRRRRRRRPWPRAPLYLTEGQTYANQRGEGIVYSSQKVAFLHLFKFKNFDCFTNSVNIVHDRSYAEHVTAQRKPF